LRALALGSKGTPNEEAFAGAYAFCDPTGGGGKGLDGDGVTTTDSATALDGAETRLLDGVTHYPWTAASPLADLIAPDLTKAYRAGKPWYGTEKVLDEWVPWLLEPFADSMPEIPEPRESPADVVKLCALKKDVPASVVSRYLEKLEAEVARERDASRWSAEIFGNAASGDVYSWDLVWSSSVADLPVVGDLLGGYFPNRETLQWDLEGRRLDLEVELFPTDWKKEFSFDAPCIQVEGKNLCFDADAGTLTYQVIDKPTTWTLIFADAEAGVIAARSSLSGYSVIRRNYFK